MLTYNIFLTRLLITSRTWVELTYFWKLPLACLPLMQVPTAQAGRSNSPNLSEPIPRPRRDAPSRSENGKETS